jgi:hypothetical protein
MLPILTKPNQLRSKELALNFEAVSLRYLIARISGFAKAFANRMETVAPLRTLFTSAGLKQAMHVPDLCRTLG